MIHALYGETQLIMEENNMPNWCENSVSIWAENEKDIQEFKKKAFKTDKDGAEVFQFNNLIPMPEEIKDTISPSDTPNWYDWANENWGTKWDVEIDDITFDEEDNSFYCSFVSAWCPPITFYETMEEMGFEVFAQYDEGGMGFFGRYSGGGDRGYNYDDVDTDALQETIISYNNEWCADEYDITNTKKGDLIYGEEDGKSIPLYLYIQDKEYSHLELFKDILGDWLEEDLEVCPKYNEGILEQPESKKYIVCELLQVGSQDIVYGVKENNNLFCNDW